MTTLDRYLACRLAMTLIKTIAALVLLFVLIDLLTHLRIAILRQDVPWNVVVRYYAMLTPQIIHQYVAPLAMLVAALFVLGDSAQNNEITAVLAGGISLRRFVRAPLALALLFSVGLLGFEETLGVRAAQEADRLDASYFSPNRDSERAGVSWANLDSDWTCHIMKFNRTALTGEGVRMYSVGHDMVERIEARRIFWDPTASRWLVEDGLRLVFRISEDSMTSTRITQTPAPFSERPDELLALDQRPVTKTARQLAADIRRAEARRIPAAGFWSDYHAKFAQPTLSFVMMLLAVPFAMRLRRGGWAISFGTGIAVALTYLVLHEMTMDLGHAQRISPVIAAWLTNGAFLILGAALFVRTPT